MISGPLDVDKREDIQRHGCATGLQLVVDLDRFFSAIDVRRGSPHRDQGSRTAGAKHVFAGDARRHGVPPPQGEGLRLPARICSPARHRLSGLRHIVDHLDRSDATLLEDDTNPYMRRLRYRDLPYRAAILSRETVTQGWKTALHELQKVAAAPEKRRSIQEAIWERWPPSTRAALPRSEVWFTLPAPATLRELELAFILRPGEEIVQAQQVVPTQGWIDAYKIFKSRGHVFAPKPHGREVFRATAQYLQDTCGLRFKDELVGKLCHWPWGRKPPGRTPRLSAPAPPPPSPARPPRPAGAPAPAGAGPGCATRPPGRRGRPPATA